MEHSHAPYPAFDLDCMREVVRIVRGGTILTEKKLFAKCVYELTGAGLSLTIGEPDVLGPFAGTVEPSLTDLEDCCSALQDADVFGAAEDEAIDPATIMLLVELAVKIITAIIERRKQ